MNKPASVGHRRVLAVHHFSARGIPHQERRVCKNARLAAKAVTDVAQLAKVQPVVAGVVVMDDSRER